MRPPVPAAELRPQELVRGLTRWLSEQTFNCGVFDSDPNFRPVWSRYHRLWEIHTGGYSPLHAVWLLREPQEFEEARQAVLPIMGSVLQRQPKPANLFGRVLAALAAGAP